MDKAKVAKQTVNGTLDNMINGNRRFDYAADCYMKLKGIDEQDRDVHKALTECMSVGSEVTKGQHLATGAALALFGVWAYKHVKKRTMKKNVEKVNSTEGSSES